MDDAWKKVYEENALKELESHAVSCWTRDGFEELFRVTFDLVSKLSNVKKVLDVGCGPGAYCSKFKQLGFDVVGVDYAENVIKKARAEVRGVDFRVASAYDLPFQKVFDLVVCIGVLQCVYDAEKVIGELCRVSKKYVVVSTLLRRTKLEDPLRLLHKKLETDSWPTRDYHPSELVSLFEKNGFSANVVLRNKGSFLKDGFFVVATKL